MKKDYREGLPLFYQIWNNKSNTWALLHTKTGDMITTHRPLQFPYDNIPVIKTEEDLPVFVVQEIKE